VLDNFETGHKRNLERFSGKLIDGDVRDYGCVRSAVHGVEAVFHLAALGSVPRSINDPLGTHAVNETGTLNLLDACRREGVRRVVMASSSAVYGDSQTMPKRENAMPAPVSPYGVSKLTGEYYCQVFRANYRLETVCLRYFNVFGPRQDPASEYAAVIPRFVDAALNGQRPIIYGDGTQSRDFTYVANVVEATVRAATVRGANGLIANVACGERYSLLDVIRELEALCACKLEPEFQPPRQGDILHSQAAITRARRVLGYMPRVSLRDGLRETVDWFRSKQVPASEERRMQAL
jgi:nucleoside-diphosphate-sugar epimerase